MSMNTQDLIYGWQHTATSVDRDRLTGEWGETVGYVSTSTQHKVSLYAYDHSPYGYWSESLGEIKIARYFSGQYFGGYTQTISFNIQPIALRIYDVTQRLIKLVEYAFTEESKYSYVGNIQGLCQTQGNLSESDINISHFLCKR